LGRVRKRRIVIGWAVAAVLATALWSTARDGPGAPDYSTRESVGLASGVYEYAPAERGEPVSVSGVSLTGEPLDTASYRGRVVLLNVWGSWCAPCRKEAPLLARASQRFPASQLSLVGINVRDNRAAALAFESRFDITYPSISEEESPGALLALNGYVPLNAVPVTVLLDAEGRVAARVVGVLREATLSALIDSLLSEGAAADGLD
jgi:thiol-disulfide isomerase/thioredoxin